VSSQVRHGQTNTAHPPSGHAISIAVRVCSSRSVLRAVITREAEKSLKACLSSGDSWSTSTSSVAGSLSSSDEVLMSSKFSLSYPSKSSS
jgi:hypothetical protein